MISNWMGHPIVRPLRIAAHSRIHGELPHHATYKIRRGRPCDWLASDAADTHRTSFLLVHHASVFARLITSLPAGSFSLFRCCVLWVTQMDLSLLFSYHYALVALVVLYLLLWPNLMGMNETTNEISLNSCCCLVYTSSQKSPEYLIHALRVHKGGPHTTRDRGKRVCIFQNMPYVGFEPPPLGVYIIPACSEPVFSFSRNQHLPQKVF